MSLIKFIGAIYTTRYRLQYAWFDMALRTIPDSGVNHTSSKSFDSKQSRFIDARVASTDILQAAP